MRTVPSPASVEIGYSGVFRILSGARSIWFHQTEVLLQWFIMSKHIFVAGLRDVPIILFVIDCEYKQNRNVVLLHIVSAFTSSETLSESFLPICVGHWFSFIFPSLPFFV